MTSKYVYSYKDFQGGLDQIFVIDVIFGVCAPPLPQIKKEDKERTETRKKAIGKIAKMQILDISVMTRIRFTFVALFWSIFTLILCAEFGEYAGWNAQNDIFRKSHGKKLI